jgi:hypothetical protein
VEWSYGKEWRIIRNFNEVTVIKGKDGYDIQRLQFELEHLHLFDFANIHDNGDASQ